ncbi:MAG TPA: SIMPL domain-containing protein [Accumulibacter sp.]|nr:SIMPL domain-containing protein [Accumulibacter sp.]HMW18272.1 SIMPL domain-containing protein [Accumulibacter sp.]HMY06921.1 SIMPL domain-containing protein [Accumulibacter sp.]HNC17171.1 SIMPL domain-containing protein [Accumulibacter sp.]HNE13914.1 SIMPL domain-containing protein [Accumulibacter sp.]
MTSLRRLIKSAPVLALLCATPLSTAAPAAPSATTIDLSADASRLANNDLARATVFAEASGATPGELARKVNSLVAEGLKTAKTYTSVKTRSGATHTYPSYGKSGKIDAWRMRSDLLLESSDTAALSELLGQLQNSLAVANLVMVPAPATLKKAENEAIVDAITAFRARAAVIAEALGKSYRIKQLSINSSGRPMEMPMLKTRGMLAAEAAPMPIEAGDSQITANISGQIELLD